MTDRNKKKLVHIITSVGVGGAQQMLYNLIVNSRDQFNHCVISLAGSDIWSDRYKELGVRVIFLLGRNSNSARIRILEALWSFREVGRLNPQTVVGWMYHGNLVAAFLSVCLFPGVTLVWNVRHAVHKLSDKKFALQCCILANAAISHLPDSILFNSRTSSQQHIALGFERNKAFFTPNGFDTSCVHNKTECRNALRKELLLDRKAFLVGTVGRYHKMKGQAFFLKALSVLHASTNAHFIMVGMNVDHMNSTLKESIARLGLEGRISLLGHRGDAGRIMAGLDLLVNPSQTEAFPNVLGEAMVQSVPVLATNVGDSALVLSNPKLIVEPNNPSDLANRIRDFVTLSQSDRDSIATKLRDRVTKHYDISNAVRRFSRFFAWIHHAEKAI